MLTPQWRRSCISDELLNIVDADAHDAGNLIDADADADAEYC